MKILIVEDVRFSILLIESQLKQHGHKTYAVSCGYDALDFLQSENAVDIVICDLNLPDMTGIKVLQECQELKKFKNKPASVPPFILLTSSKSTSAIREAEARGFIGVLSKPLDMNLLNEILSTIDNGNLILKNNQGKAKILVAGTNGKNAEILQDIFNGTGYTLLMASTEKECIDYLMEYRSICMVVCDLELENTNAMGLLTDIREKKCYLPDEKLPLFALMTESNNMDMIQLAHLSGFSEIITAPLEKLLVKQKLNQLLMRDPSHLIQPSILVVDDIGFHCVLTKTILCRLPQIKEQHYNILSASSGAEALDILKSDRSIQLVVTDFYLPDITGIQMFCQFKTLMEQNRHLFGSDYQIPNFILLTVTSDESIFTTAIDTGFYKVFKKPLNPTAFLPIVCELLRFQSSEPNKKTKIKNNALEQDRDNEALL